MGYDNERGKGDHRHYADREEVYAFTSVERLAADFEADVAKLRGDETKIRVGGALKDDLAAFTRAWKRIEAGDQQQERILSFESWEGLADRSGKSCTARRSACGLNGPNP